MNRTKKAIICVILWLCTVCMMLFCCDTRGLFPAISNAEDVATVLYDTNSTSAIDDRFYLVNRAGNYVCVQLEDPGHGAVKSVQIFDASRIIPTQFHFSLIKAGMSPEQVTALVGIPFQPMSEGISRSAYEAADGTVYAIAWSKDSQTGEVITAGGAEKIESMRGPGIAQSAQLRAWICNHITAAFLLAAIFFTAATRKKHSAG